MPGKDCWVIPETWAVALPQVSLLWFCGTRGTRTRLQSILTGVFCSTNPVLPSGVGEVIR